MGSKRKLKNPTKTSSFGAPGRENHDSSKFYKSNLYQGLRAEKKIEYKENKINKEHLNKIYCKSSEQMEELPDNSIHLMVTSPPYSVGKEYDKDLTLDSYIKFLETVWKEVYRVLVPGGRACINVANLGRKPYIPLHKYIIDSMDKIGFLLRGEIIWDKSASAGTSTAWGSWNSASNPILRDVHEYVVIFSKDTYKRLKSIERENTITKEEFLLYTKSIWKFPTVSAKKIGHPAPFPEELPYRCIQLYSYKNETVLDPFIGSGQTAIAALKAGRNYIGYETSKDYVELTNNRIIEFLRPNKVIRLDELIKL